MSVVAKKWLTKNFPFGYFESYLERSNQAVRWKKNYYRKKANVLEFKKNEARLKVYKQLRWFPYAANSASRNTAKDFVAIRSTKPFCQFTLMTRSLVPHVKISKHAFKRLAREGYMIGIRKP